MRIPRLKLVCSAILLATLGVVPLAAPHFADLARAATDITSLQCGPGGVVTLAVSASPVGTAAVSAAPVGTSTTIPGLTCTPVSAPVASTFSATATVTTCGVVTAYTAPTPSAAGSLTVNDLTISIPAGSANPDFLTTGTTAIVAVLIPGGQLVEISPGFCGPNG